jgi:hypothetical protein
MLGIGRTLCRAARVFRRSITAEDGDARMGAEPRVERIGRTIGPEVDWPMALQIHQQGTIGTPTTSRPIVHAKDGGRHHGRVWQLADETQQSIRAGRHMARGAQPCPGFAAECETEWLQDNGQAHAALSRRPHQLRKSSANV